MACGRGVYPVLLVIARIPGLGFLRALPPVAIAPAITLMVVIFASQEWIGGTAGQVVASIAIALVFSALMWEYVAWRIGAPRFGELALRLSKRWSSHEVDLTADERAAEAAAIADWVKAGMPETERPTSLAADEPFGPDGGEPVELALAELACVLAVAAPHARSPISRPVEPRRDPAVERELIRRGVLQQGPVGTVLAPRVIPTIGVAIFAEPALTTARDDPTTVIADVPGHHAVVASLGDDRWRFVAQPDPELRAPKPDLFAALFRNDGGRPGFTWPRYAAGRVAIVVFAIMFASGFGIAVLNDWITRDDPIAYVPGIVIFGLLYFAGSAPPALAIDPVLRRQGLPGSGAFYFLLGDELQPATPAPADLSPLTHAG